MSAKKLIDKRRKRKAERVRKRIAQESSFPRVTVFRSANHIYAQVIDDAQQKTVTSCSSVELKDLKGDKKEVAYSVGKELAKRAKDKGVDQVVFDRGFYLYHGRVKALAEGLREGGLHV